MGQLSGEQVGAEEAQRRTDELVAELCQRAEVAETEAEGLCLRLAEGSVPLVVVVAGQGAPETLHATVRPPRSTAPYR